MLKFLHAADIHLDSPLCGLERYETAPAEKIRGATRRAFEKLVDLAISEEVAFVLLAGDLYDGDWRDYNTGLFFNRQMARLRDAGVQVFVVTGNHDAQSRITRSLHPPDNVKLLSVKKPETVVLERLGVAIHGQGYATQKVMEDLSAGYPDAAKGMFNIGLLHTSLDGRPGHAPYAPCSLSGLRSRGYQYWALGHVHTREVVCEEPHVVFPGCIQGRNARETGPKGCTLVSVDNGEVTGLEHRDLDVVRWTFCAVDLTGADSTGEVLERVTAAMAQEVARAGGRPLAMRLSLEGACKASDHLRADPEHWTQQMRSTAGEPGAGEIWVEKVLFRTRRLQDLKEMLSRKDALGGLLRVIQGLSADEDRVAGLAHEFDVLRSKLPAELTQGEHGLDPTNHEVIAEALAQARELLTSRLLSAEEER